MPFPSRLLFAGLGLVTVGLVSCGDDGSGSAALDPAPVSAPFTVEQVASTVREDVPSALENPSDERFDEPLIDLSSIRAGGPPPDGIPSLDRPTFETVESVGWLEPEEAVLALEIDGVARAYPVRIMIWHELVNDTVAGVPVTVSYCPLCNSALAYDRRLGDRILDFGTSGRLYNSSLVMYDRQTESLWTHFDGTAVVGALVGERLDTFPVATVSWEDFAASHPAGTVLSLDTEFTRDYGRNPYDGYDDVSTTPFLYDGPFDDRLEPKARVVVVRAEGRPAVALELGRLLADDVVAFDAHGRDVVAVLDPGTASPLHRSEVAAGYDQGAVGVFLAELEGRPVDLVRIDEGFRDEVSGRVFDVLGRPVDDDGPALVPVEHLDTFWFAIVAFDEGVELR